MASSGDIYTVYLGTSIADGTTKANPKTVGRDIPVTATLDGVLVRWPSGTGGDAGVGITTGTGERIFPRNEEDNYVPADDWAEQFPLKRTVTGGRTVEARFFNTSGSQVDLPVAMGMIIQ